MVNKIKQTQKQNLTESHGRDNFYTPRYATELILPFVKQLFRNKGFQHVSEFKIWECANGDGKISNVLREYGYTVIGTDLRDKKPFNFLSDVPNFEFDLILTNPPFSIKEKFYKKCLEYKKPFALLVPADYSKWNIKEFMTGKTEKIIPSARIDYLTPNMCEILWQKEVFALVKNTNEYTFAWKKYSDLSTSIVNEYGSGVKRYEKVEDIPVEKITRNFSAQFHSMWLVNKFNLFKTETFVELTNEMKKNIF